jgi:hypothetical protein
MITVVQTERQYSFNGSRCNDSMYTSCATERRIEIPSAAARGRHADRRVVQWQSVPVSSPSNCCRSPNDRSARPWRCTTYARKLKKTISAAAAAADADADVGGGNTAGAGPSTSLHALLSEFIRAGVRDSPRSCLLLPLCCSLLRPSILLECVGSYGGRGGVCSRHRRIRFPNHVEYRSIAVILGGQAPAVRQRRTI